MVTVVFTASVGRNREEVGMNNRPVHMRPFCPVGMCVGGMKMENRQ
jgi:hypothetical protein